MEIRCVRCILFPKAQGLAPKICPIGDETIISIENISYNNIRWEICSMLFSSHKLWDVQFIKNYFKQKDQNEDYDDIKVMLSKQYPHYPPVNLKWRAATTEAYCIEDKKTLLSL